MRDCNLCKSASLRIGFTLCEECSKEIEAAKSSGELVETVEKNRFFFQIFKINNSFMVNLLNRGEEKTFLQLAGSFLDRQHCLAAIDSWIAQPFSNGCK